MKEKVIVDTGNFRKTVWLTNELVHIRKEEFVNGEWLFRDGITFWRKNAARLLSILEELPLEE